jgi:RimK family alpha-L-glutamate ligase
MKKFTDILNEKYVLNVEALKNIICENIDDKMIKTSNLKEVKKLIFIGETKSESIAMLKNDGVKTYHASPSTLEFNVKPNKIEINDETKITLTPSDCEHTIVLMRSGYSEPIIYLLTEISKFGILVINDVESTRISSNKFNTAEMLSKYNIAQPKYCLITKNDVSKDDTKGLEDKINSLYANVDDDTKFVCKILGGHGGKGVFLCTKSNIVSIMQCAFKLKDDTNILVQEYLNIKEGDIRVNVLSLNGKQKIFNVTMRRKDSDDFRTNLSLGNTLDNNVTLTKEQEQLALNAAKCSGLVWAGIDLLPTDKKTVVLEINGSPGPMSDINTNDAVQVNYKFYKNLIETINELC